MTDPRASSAKLAGGAATVAEESPFVRAQIAQLEARLHAGTAPGAGASGQDWLEPLRAAAFERFQSLGLPTTHDEEWRFTSVAAIEAVPFVRAHASSSNGRAAVPHPEGPAPSP